MKKFSFAALAVLVGLAAVSCEKEETVSKSYTLDAGGFLSTPDSVYMGTDRSRPAGYYFAQDIVIGKFVLSHSFGDWGFGEGFTITNCDNDSTPGYSNLSAITAKGVKGDSYFVANGGGHDTPAEISFSDSAAYRAIECYVTNSTYAYMAMKYGNDGYGGVKKDWGKNDRFTLTVTGYNGAVKSGSVEFLLADGCSIADTWQRVDLSALGLVTRIRFTLSSTDNDPVWGMNTPSYFCLDQLKVSE